VTETPVTSGGIYNKEVTKEVTNKSFSDVKVQNSIKHPFAVSMDQMANEKKHLEEHEKRKARELQMKRINSVSPILQDFMNKQEKH
jgi:hypothetical protein